MILHRSLRTPCPSPPWNGFFNELPDDEELNDVETKAFNRMRRLIAGEYKNGVSMSEIG